jgi:hypothetical protein
MPLVIGTTVRDLEQPSTLPLAIQTRETVTPHGT